MWVPGGGAAGASHGPAQGCGAVHSILQNQSITLTFLISSFLGSKPSARMATLSSCKQVNK